MINTDWKKQAQEKLTKQSGQILDEKEVERAFMDQAYNFISNKAGPLMEDSHRLGFEVVYTDEDHTRMVGMFAFRVNDELLYAPCFFLNGQIRGTDLLYTHKNKKFCPLNKDWATYKVEKQKDSMGHGIDPRDTRKMPMDIELEDIAYPPGTYSYKSAAVVEMFEKMANSFAKSMDSDIKALIEKYLHEHSTDNEKPTDAKCNEVKDKRVEEHKAPEQDHIESGNVKKSALREFILNDGGIEAVEKIASWMRENKAFAELIVSNVAPDDYMPEELIEKMAKQASEMTRPELVMYTGGLEAFTQVPQDNLEKTASAQEEFFRKGYYLWDDRAPGKLNPATVDLQFELCKPGEPGLYEILLQDGTMREAFVAAPAKQSFSDDRNKMYAAHPDAWCDQWDHDQPRELAVIFKDGGESGIIRRIHGKYVKSLSDCIRDDEFATEMSSGKTYRVYDAEAGVLSEPVHCLQKRDKDGLVIYDVATECYGPDIEIRQNKDYNNSSFDANFLGKDVYFIPVSLQGSVNNTSYHRRGSEKNCHTFSVKELPAIGDDKTLTQYILNTGIKQASLLRDRVDSNLFSLRAGPKKQTHYQPRHIMAAKCASKLGIHADVVEELLDKAASEGRVDFFVGEPGIEKFAAPISVVDEEDWRQDYDSEFNIPLDFPQAFTLDTQTNGPIPPEQRIGDAYDPGMGMTAEDGQSLSSDVILGAPVEQLEQLKAQAGVPNVFEHGLIGSLIHTYDSASMIEKYIPDLEDALDRLGRILFLYYWKPRDFEDAYGADDMANLENQLLSTFQSFGELVLELLKKSDKAQKSRGNVSMYSA